MTVYNSPKRTRNVREKWDKVYSKPENNGRVLVMRIPPDPIVSTAKTLKRERRGSELAYLDIGCGHGLYAVKMAEMGFMVVGIDVSEVAIQRARELAGVRRDITFIVGNPLRRRIDGTFDLVASNFVLQLVKEAYKPRFIENMMVHTAPGGYNVVVFHTQHLARANSKKEWGGVIEGFQRELDTFYMARGWSVIANEEGFSGRNYNGKPVHWGYIVAKRPTA